MSNNSAIEWTDATWNPVTGCTKVSPGCAHCYAERQDHRFDRDQVGKLPWAFPVSRGGRGVTLHPERLDQPLRLKKPCRIFVNSMSDLFHEDVPDEFLPRIFAVMAATNWHTYQVLTKRPERMMEVISDPIFYEAVDQEARHVHGCGEFGPMPWPLPNVWLGVSVENQLWADRRIPLLLQTPAAVRFISCEPLLGPVDLHPRPSLDMCIRCGEGPEAPHNHPDGYRNKGLDWVIAGGESGPKARPMHPDWVRSLRDQCQAAGVPFFFKQWGEYEPGISTTFQKGRFTWVDGVSSEEFYRRDYDMRFMARVGKKAAGAVLDGREWREFPTIGNAPASRPR